MGLGEKCRCFAGICGYVGEPYLLIAFVFVYVSLLARWQCISTVSVCLATLIYEAKVRCVLSIFPVLLFMSSALCRTVRRLLLVVSGRLPVVLYVGHYVFAFVCDIIVLEKNSAFT